MNIRKIYIGLIVFLLMGLFYAWTSETRALSTATHMSEVEYEKSLPTVSDDGNYISIENDLLKIRVAVKTGAIVEARLKKYR